LSKETCDHGHCKSSSFDARQHCQALKGFTQSLDLNVTWFLWCYNDVIT